jgi:hypothetical protein
MAENTQLQPLAAGASPEAAPIELSDDEILRLNAELVEMEQNLREEEAARAAAARAKATEIASRKAAVSQAIAKARQRKIAGLMQQNADELSDVWPEAKVGQRVMVAFVKGEAGWLPSVQIGPEGMASRPRLVSPNVGRALPAADSASLEPGSVLTRDYNGVKYEVLVLDDGSLEWEGQRYSSISAVAKAILTAVHGPLTAGGKPHSVNGRTWFGLA